MSTLFNLSPSLTDTSIDANASNARIDLDRAIDRGGDHDLAQWARAYGPSLCDAAEDRAAMDDEAQDAFDKAENLERQIEGFKDDYNALMEEVEGLRSPASAAAFVKIDEFDRSINETLNETPTPKAKAA